MSLFKVHATPITKLGITAYPIVPEFFDTITSYLNSLEKNNLTYWMSIPMLIYGGNHYFQEIDGYLYLYHLYKNNPELICVPFNKKGEYLNIHYTADYMQEMDILKILAVPECSDWFKDVDSVKIYFRIYENGEGYEFIYDNKEMFEMQGGKWSNFRHNVHRFIKNNGEPELIPYSSSIHREFMSVYDQWSDIFSSKHTLKIWDSGFYKTTIKMFPDTSFLVCLNNESVGVISFAVMCDDMCYGIHRKLLNKYDYLAQYLQWKQAGLLLQKGIRYLDDSDDNNILGLRMFKFRMHPIKFFKNFLLIRGV